MDPNNPNRPTTPLPYTSNSPIDPRAYTVYNQNAWQSIPPPQFPWQPPQLQQQFQQQFMSGYGMPTQGASMPGPGISQDRSEHDYVSLSQDDDVIPETQPEPSKKTKGKGKKRGQEEAKSRCISWTTLEEEVLARAWINISQDPIIGTNQTGDGFWNRVTENFHTLLQCDKPYRLFHSVSSKFRDMNKKIGWFAGYYNNISIHRPSGAGDDNVLTLALEKYKNKHNHAFQHVKAWEILKNSPKWAPVPDEPSRAKRSKTSESTEASAGASDARCNININSDPENDLPTPPEPTRPPGRDKSKKAAAAKRNVVGEDKIDQLLVQFSEFQQHQTEKLNKKQAFKESAKEVELEKIRLERERLAAERENNEFRIMSTDLSHLPEKEREVAIMMKNKIMERWLGGAGGSGSGSASGNFTDV